MVQLGNWVFFTDGFIYVYKCEWLYGWLYCNGQCDDIFWHESVIRLLISLESWCFVVLDSKVSEEFWCWIMVAWFRVMFEFY